MTDQERVRYAYSAGKSVYEKKDFPKGDHYAIITFGSITIPGDERSRTHPGHGYPESTQSTMEYKWYKLEDKCVWEEKIIELLTPKYGYPKSFIALDKGKMIEPKLKMELA